MPRDQWRPPIHLQPVPSLTFLALDFQDSTVFFSALGDSSVCPILQSLFVRLRLVYVPYGGLCFKQTGDGELHTYPTPGAALAAGLAMQRCARDFLMVERLNIGVHQGPAAAVCGEDGSVQDYLGLNVNLVARLQAQARDGEILFSESLLDHPSTFHALRRHPGLSLRPEPLPLKGLRHPHPAIRLTRPEQMQEAA